MLRPALIVHGGAGARRAEPHAAVRRAAQQAACGVALRAGWQVLSAGGSAVDAVCAAVIVLEDDPHFDAGVGSSLTSAGGIQMDAGVMDGDGRRAGAAAVVQRVRNPIRLARLIMEDGRHVMLAGPDADEFARASGLPLCDPQELVTERQLRRWRASQGTGTTETGATGTVGAVAVDRNGHVAAATSTGGIVGKRPGRIGDSPIIGAGTYADDTLGAASATGQGEAIIRVALAYRVVSALRSGVDPGRAARAGLQALRQDASGSGGIIVADPLGRLGHAHNAEHMTVAFMRADLADFVVHA